MNLTDLVSLFSQYGTGGIALSIFIYFAYTILKGVDFGKYAADKIKKIKDKISNKKEGKSRIITESDILNHDIFSYIDFWTYSKIPTFQFSTQYRTIVFRKYLTIYLKKHKENLTRYIHSKSFENMDPSEIWKSLLSLINTTIYDYETEMINEGIPKIIVEKMKTNNNDRISLTIDLIEGICNSQFYESDKNYLKVYSILNIMLSILENTISNSDNICNSINGQLKGLKFSDNGVVYQEP